MCLSVHVLSVRTCTLCTCEHVPALICVCLCVHAYLCLSMCVRAGAHGRCGATYMNVCGPGGGGGVTCEYMCTDVLQVKVCVQACACEGVCACGCEHVNVCVVHTRTCTHNGWGVHTSLSKSRSGLRPPAVTRSYPGPGSPLPTVCHYSDPIRALSTSPRVSPQAHSTSPRSPGH